jgi:F0F1-type ATP synthase membrane subunit b/b'
LLLLKIYPFFSLVLCLHAFFLPEILHRAEERADDLEAQLKASEKARQKAEKNATRVEDLRRNFKPLKMPSVIERPSLSNATMT